jgi:hypothetical protein
VGEHRRVDAARKLAQLGERQRELVAGVRDQCLGRGRVATDLGLDQPQLDAEGDEALLRAVRRRYR